nr:hypothetical protein [Tanacetum cinerariifolium]
MSTYKRDRIYVLGEEEFGLFSHQYFLRGSAGREFLEKSKHFSRPTIDPLTLLEYGILKSFHSFEGEVPNDLPRFVGVLIVEFSAGGAVNFVLKMKGNMIIKNLDLDPTIDAMDIVAKFCGPSRWKELRKESDSKILPCGDGSCWKTLKLIASLIAKGKLKYTQACSLPIFTIKVKRQCKKHDVQLSLDFYKKFYNSLGRAPNRCSSSIGKTLRVVIVYSRIRLGRLDQEIVTLSPATEKIILRNVGVVPGLNDPEKVYKMTPHQKSVPAKEDVSSKKPSRKKSASVFVRDTPGMSVSKKKALAKVDRGKGMDLLSNVALLEAAQLKKVLKKSNKDTHMLHASGLEDGVRSQPKVLDELQDKTTGINEGTGTIPRVPDKKALAKVDRGKGMDLLSNVALLEAAQLKKVLKRSNKDTHMLHASGLEDGVRSPPKGESGDDDDSNDNDNNDDNDDDNNVENEFVHTPGYYVPTEDETNNESNYVTKEEYERINKVLYGDVNVSLKDVELADKEKGDVEMTVAGQVNVNQEGEALLSTIVKEYLGISLDDALYKVLMKHDADIIKEHYVLAEIVERFRRQYVLEKSTKDFRKIKIEHARKQQEPKETITSSDTFVLEEFDQKTTLFETMTKSKSFNKIPKQRALYHALIESILKDEDAMDEGVTDKLKKEIDVRKEDRQLYRFKEGDFPRLHLHDIEDMLLLLVQKKFSNLERDVIFDLGVALQMFTRRSVILKRVEDLQLGVESYQKKLNITKPQTFKSDISSRTSYTAYNNPQGIIYVDKYNKNMLMRSDQLYKFSDKTLTSIRTILHDIDSNLRMDYLPKKRWSNLDR